MAHDMRWTGLSGPFRLNFKHSLWAYVLINVLICTLCYVDLIAL